MVIPKARGGRNSLLHISAPKVREVMGITLSYIGQTVCHHFFSCSRLHPACKKGLEDTTYPAMDSPINGESDSESCILVEDCIRKL